MFFLQWIGIGLWQPLHRQLKIALQVIGLGNLSEFPTGSGV
jgi:hypothetical protein